jgi:hypothetical protein
MAMRIDHARQHDRTARIDYLRVGGIESPRNRGDSVALNKHVGIGKVADRSIHRRDVTATYQTPVRGHFNLNRSHFNSNPPLVLTLTIFALNPASQS